MIEDVAGALSGVELEQGLARGRLTFQASLPVFEGHFPGRPTLPGVYLIEAARTLAQRSLGCRLGILRVDSAKFRAPVGPGEELEASVQVDAAADPPTCDARFEAAGKPIARIKLRLSPIK